VQLGQLGQHAQRLGALTGEHESKGGIGHAIVRLMESKRAMIKANRVGRLYVRVCTMATAATGLPDSAWPSA